MAGMTSFVHAQCPPVRLVSPDTPDQSFRFGSWFASNADQGGSQWVISETNQVWAYEMIDGQLELRQELRAPAELRANLFGSVVDMEGDRMAIGSYSMHWPDRHPETGGALVYDLIDGQWVLSGELKPPIDLAGRGSGTSVTLHGDMIFASSFYHATVVVHRPEPSKPEGWSVAQRIEGPRDASWGGPIVPVGDWLFIGASRDDSVSRTGGSVFVYRRGAEGVYEQVQKIDGPAEVPYPIILFGQSLDCDGRTLAIGARGASPVHETQGAVYIYELDDDRWTQRQTLTNRSAQEDDEFGGYAVRVRGDRMVVNASGDRSERSDWMAYAFKRTASGVWRQSARLLPNPPYHAAHYASRMTLHGDMLLVGSSYECEGPGTDTTGAAYLFDLSCYECPDLDADDRLTVFDYLEFMRAFDAGEAIADMDNDGSLTVADFLAFQDAFAVGCP